LAGVRQYRADDYVNMLNKYGTEQDNSTAYEFQHDGIVPDMSLTEQYESNGLFAKIIDAPAEEAVKHGYDLGLKETDEITQYIKKALDRLKWEDSASTAIKWSRLYGGALGVMLINDGGGIDEPLNWRRIKDIEEIRVYERAVVYPDYSSLYKYDPQDPTRSATPRFGMPEYYQVNSIYGQFWVHESRCLIFKNGIVPERTMQPFYRFWGIPEYIRIRRELRETLTSHSTGVKMLERSVQAIYSMKGLADLLATDEGMNIVIRRLQAIDMARGILNSIAIDNDGESYEFKNIQMAGVKDTIDTTCNLLSAVTSIPQTILFGRSPAGQNSTGKSDLENWYNYVEKIQKLNLRDNMSRLVDVVVAAGQYRGIIVEKPEINLAFNPLWSMSETEKVAVDQQKAQTQLVRAQAAQMYVDMGVLQPSEIRRGLAQEGEFQIEELIDGEDVQGGDLWGGAEAPPAEPAAPGIAPSGESGEREVMDGSADYGSVGVLVVKDGEVLIGRRTDNHLIGGPGGHIEAGENPKQAAVRETFEEFNILPTDLQYVGQLDGLDPKYGKPHIFICTDFKGRPKCKSPEMTDAAWARPDNLVRDCFPPFLASLGLLEDCSQNPKIASVSGGRGDGKEPENALKKALTAGGLRRIVLDADKEPLRDKNGQFASEGASGTGGNDPPKFSATGANPSLPPFTGSALDNHWGGKNDHSGEYPNFTKEQYAERALNLVRSSVSKGVLGYKAANGSIVRYDKAANDFVKGHDTGIATMFKPKSGEAYFNRQIKKDGGKQDD